MAQVHGSCSAQFSEIESLLKKFIESGDELGASITVNIDGVNVVDVWGGYADKDRKEPWNTDTIVNVFSSTKLVTSLAVLMLVDRGLLDVNEKVAHYWPEFGQNGKQDIEVRHLLAHTSGISGWDDKMTAEDLFNFDETSAKLAAQAPWWTPGSASGYQAMSMGFLLGTLVHRVSGKTLKEFVAEEIAGPLKADFQIGALEKDWPRVTSIVPPTDGAYPELDPNSLPARTLFNPILDPTVANTAPWRNADLGAVNGHGNARSLVRMLSAIPLGGEVDGKRILSQKTIDLIFKEQARGPDQVLGVPLRFGIGYGLAGEAATSAWLPSGNICFWGGWGGSVVIMDADRRMTIAYAMNQMGSGILGSERSVAYVSAVYKAMAGAKL